MNNSDLPIAAFRDRIVEAVRDCPVVIITAETGAGKSTQVPQYLLAAGYRLVVTQPRRLATRTIATRVAEECSEPIGQTIGYRTAFERDDSASTRCLFCTDGLALVQELMGRHDLMGQGDRKILIIDEVHEWNENIETLVAWVKYQIQNTDFFKVVLMSATLEADRLSTFFNSAPVISVPGRLFPIEERRPSVEIVKDVVMLVVEGRNTLVFLPGKSEIEELCTTLTQMSLNAEILPLHGQLTPDQQSLCFRQYRRPKVVVSTNVAQTSVTIDDIDAVVDCGTERRIETVNGVEGLYLKPISEACSNQRKGRCGRTKEGVYINHGSGVNRLLFPVPEIMRKRLDQVFLRLTIAGLNMEELDFFHQPNQSDIRDAHRSLVRLGCINDDMSVTPIGELVNKLPVAAKYARMLVEADRLGVVGDVVIICAILEVKGITLPPPSTKAPNRPDWRELVNESESDLMGQLAVWRMAQSMSKDEMRKKGISPTKYYRAKEILYHLKQVVDPLLKLGSTGSREHIIRAVCSGMVDHLYKYSYGSYVKGDYSYRELSKSSLVNTKGRAEWLIGEPFDMEVKESRRTRILKLIELASVVDPVWLADTAPQLARCETGLNPYYEVLEDSVFSTTRIYFNGQLINDYKVVDQFHPEALLVFSAWLAEITVEQDRSWLQGKVCAEDDKVKGLIEVLKSNKELLKSQAAISVRAGHEVFEVQSKKALTEFFAKALGQARNRSEIIDVKALLLPPLDEALVAKVYSDNPDRITVMDQVFEVDYRASGDAIITMNFDWEDISWTNLPDVITLPGGREVLISFKYEAVLSSKFKSDVLRRLREKLWSNWQKPELLVPVDLILPVKELEYSRCPVTNEQLIAFGVIEYQGNNWKVYWTRDKDSAYRVYSHSCKVLAELKENELKKILKSRVADFYGTHHNKLSPGLLSKFDHLRPEVADMEDFLKEAQAEIVEFEKQVAQAESKRRKLEAFSDKLISLECYPIFYLWIANNDDGMAYLVHCHSKKIAASPALNKKVPKNLPLNFDGALAIRVGSNVTIEVDSKLCEEIELFIPKTLQTGAYGIGYDDYGQYIFVNKYSLDVDSEEFIPQLDQVEKIRVPDTSNWLERLRQKFS